MFPIWIYRKVFSPFLPRRCKFYPTCSAYAMQALQRHGLFKGMLLAVWRLLRCNPWSAGGMDDVPEDFRFFKQRTSNDK